MLQFLQTNKIIVLSLSLLFFSYLSAQKNKKADPKQPPFGIVEKADLEMKQCSFDDNAEAMVLLDDGVLEYVFGRGMEMSRRVRIKILNSKGLEWANVHLSYRSEFNAQDIMGLEAQTYNLDAGGNMVITKLERKLIYEKKLNKKFTEKVFTFPEVKVGSIIEYRFRHSGIGLIDWYFQRSIPVRYSHFTIDFPSEIEVATTPFCSRPYQSNTQSKAARVVKNYSLSDEPAFRNEPNIINEAFYRDRLETKVTAYSINGRRINRNTNWPQVIKFLIEDADFGLQIKKNIPRTTALDEKLKNITAPYERMKIIYKYVQEEMVWNDYAGIWALDGVRSAWKDKKGTVGEINLILVNLLKDAGLNAHPVLVSSHDHGIVNPADAGTIDYPGFYQFNKAMAYIEINGTVYVLDATQKNTPVHLLPSDILLTEGLVIEKFETSEWGWKHFGKADSQQRTY
ncbi:MAG: DUF3857 domain-containing protein [Chitinophagaceae bacterium]